MCWLWPPLSPPPPLDPQARTQTGLPGQQPCHFMPLQHGNSSNTKNPIHGAAGSHVVRPPGSRAASAEEWPLLQALGRCLGCWTGKDNNRAGVAALAEGLVFQAQQRILSSSLGPQRGGTLEVAQSLQSPACEAPEGNLRVWSALDTRLRFPASSPIPCSLPPKFFCPFLIGQKRQGHQRPGKEGTLYKNYIKSQHPYSKSNRAS